LPTEERAQLVEATAVEALRRAEDVEERLPAVAEAYVRENMVGAVDMEGGEPVDELWLYALPSAQYHYRDDGDKLYEYAVQAVAAQIEAAGREWFRDGYLTLSSDGRKWFSWLHKRGEGPAYDGKPPGDFHAHTIPEDWQAYYWPRSVPQVDLDELDVALAELM
jgi:hypothetical protein